MSRLSTSEIKRIEEQEFPYNMLHKFTDIVQTFEPNQYSQYLNPMTLDYWPITQNNNIFNYLEKSENLGLRCFVYLKQIKFLYRDLEKITMQRDRYKKLAEEKTQLVITYKNQLVSLNRQLTFFRSEQKKNYMPVLPFVQEYEQDFLINVQENHHNEFKARHICYDFSNPANYDLNPYALRQIGKSLIGFLNADGGTLYIGVEDSGLVNGIKFINREHLDQFTKQVDNLMLNVVPIIFDKFYDYSYWRVNDAIVILLTVPAQVEQVKKRYMFKGSRDYYVRHHSMTRRIDIADVE
jgi:hypothetical protein